MIQNLTRIALAGLVASVTSFPGLALAMDRKPMVIVMPAPGHPNAGAPALKARHLIIDRLASRGYVVLDGTRSRTGSAAHRHVELRIDAKPRRLTGRYTLQAVIELSATLRDGHSKRHLGRFETPASPPRRIATNCAQACQDHLYLEQIQPLASGLVTQLHRRLSRLTAADVMSPAALTTHSLTFRGIKPARLPQIEQYLRLFPGIRNLQRDRTTQETVLYRYRQSGTPHATELSLRKMLQHLQFDARLQQVGDSFVITQASVTRPVQHSRDW